MELEGLEPSASTLPASRSSQLSYSPFEVEVLCKVIACSLAVARRLQAQVRVVRCDHRINRQEDTAIELAAVDGEQVDLIRRVHRSHVSARYAPGRTKFDNYRVFGLAQSSPLHLHTPQPVADLEHYLLDRWSRDQLERLSVLPLPTIASKAARPAGLHGTGFEIANCDLKIRPLPQPSEQLQIDAFPRVLGPVGQTPGSSSARTRLELPGTPSGDPTLPSAPGDPLAAHFCETESPQHAARPGVSSRVRRARCFATGVRGPVLGPRSAGLA